MPGSLTRVNGTSTTRELPGAQEVDWESLAPRRFALPKPAKPAKPARPQSMLGAGAAPVKPRQGVMGPNLSPMMSGQYPTAFLSGQQPVASRGVVTGGRGTTGRAAPTTQGTQLEKAWAGMGPLGQGQAFLASLPGGGAAMQAYLDAHPRLGPGSQVIPGYRKSAYDGSLIPVSDPRDVGSYEVLSPQEAAAFTDMMISATGDANYQFNAKDYVDWMNQGAGAGRGPTEEDPWTGLYANQAAAMADLQNSFAAFLEQGGGGGQGGVPGELTALLNALQQYPYAASMGMGAQNPTAVGIQGSPWVTV